MQKLPMQKYVRMSNIDMPKNGGYSIQMKVAMVNIENDIQYETRVCFQNCEPNT